MPNPKFRDEDEAGTLAVQGRARGGSWEFSLSFAGDLGEAVSPSSCLAPRGDFRSPSLLLERSGTEEHPQRVRKCSASSARLMIPKVKALAGPL